jgi:hypothetical protein
LVEQRLEQVVCGSGYQLDVDWGPVEGLGHGQATEAGPDDDNLMPTLWCGRG